MVSYRFDVLFGKGGIKVSSDCDDPLDRGGRKEQMRCAEREKKKKEKKYRRNFYNDQPSLLGVQIWQGKSCRVIGISVLIGERGLDNHPGGCVYVHPVICDKSRWGVCVTWIDIYGSVGLKSPGDIVGKQGASTMAPGSCM